jgi:hypothetical protein
MKKLLLVAAIGISALLASPAKAQVSLNVNIGTPQPYWVPERRVVVVSEGGYLERRDYRPRYTNVVYRPERRVIYREAPVRRYYSNRNTYRSYERRSNYRFEGRHDNGRHEGRGNHGNHGNKHGRH